MSHQGTHPALVLQDLLSWLERTVEQCEHDRSTGPYSAYYAGYLSGEIELARDVIKRIRTARPSHHIPGGAEAQRL